MQVINGEVTFSRTVKPADYEGKTASVKLGFVIEEGEDALNVTSLVMGKAQNVALTAVGFKHVGEDTAISAPVPAIVRKPRATPPKVEPQAEAPADPFGLPATDQVGAVSPGTSPVDGLSTPHPSSSPTAQAHTAATSGPTVTIGASPSEPEEPPITDDQLLSALTRKNGAMVAAGKPRAVPELVVSMTGDPLRKVYTLDQPQRREFLAKLEALA